MKTPSEGRLFGLLSVLFLLSGISGLIYEIVWFRMLIRLFGVTIHAVSTVLVVFMGGLAIGSILGGRYARGSRRWLALYGAIEISIGALAALVTLVLEWLPHALRDVLAAAGHGSGILALRFVVSTLLLLAPTLLMGATLPVLSGGLARLPGLAAKRIGTLYAINTLGAVAGVILAAFLLLLLIGERGTVWVAAAINVFVGILAIWLDRSGGHEAAQPIHEPATMALRPEQRRLLWIYAASGFCALAFQVIWSRILILLLGNSVYGFSSMLAVYLVGLAAGSMIAARSLREGETPPARILALLEIGTGVLALLSLHLYIGLGHLDTDPRFTYSTLWSLRDFINLPLHSAVIVLPVTLLLGAMFPIVTTLFGITGEPAASVGKIYGYNTLGSIAGSFVTGFFLIPLLGTFGAFVLASAASVALGMVVWWPALSGPDGRKSFPLLGLLLVAWLALALQAPRDPVRSILEARIPARDRIVHHVEDTTATITLIADRNYPEQQAETLSINGLHVSGVGFAGRFMVHMPLLFNPAPKKSLIVGLGAGEAYCGSLDHGVDTTAVELAPPVVSSFRWFHTDWSRYFDRPDGRVVINDGRNFVLGAQDEYDLILVDGTPPIFASGMVNLYTRDFAELVRSRLTEKGVFALWVPTVLFESDFWQIARALADTFPQMTVWAKPDLGGMEIMATRSKEPLFDVGRETIAARIAARGLPLEVTPDVIFDHLLLTDAEIRAYASRYPPLTDDRPYTEFPLFRFWRGEKLELYNSFLLRARAGAK